MQIHKPEQSAYETADSDIRDMLDRLVAELRASSSWEQRSEQLLEFIDALEMAFDPEDIEEGEAEDEDDLDEDFDDEDDELAAGTAGGDSLDKDAAWTANGYGEEDIVDEEEAEAEFAETLPFYVGAVLERLDEKTLDSPEQAAFYMLSCHPEHIEAAEAWLQEGGNMERFRSFVEATPDYGTLLEMMEEYYDEEPE